MKFFLSCKKPNNSQFSFKKMNANYSYIKPNELLL